jgi:ribosomal protein S8
MVIRAYGNRILCLHINPYVLTFYLGLGIGVIRPTFDISILFLVGYHMHLFGLLLNREIGMGIAILSTSRGIMTDREA